MAFLNFHHLRYFWVIAREGSLTRAARRLSVSQSALSTQLRQLEEQLGSPLFERRHKKLELTEAGRMALEHAETIFRTGEELLDTLQGRSRTSRQVLRVGAMATLSRNFQLEWLRPLIGREDVEIVLHSGSLREILAQLDALTLDVVLSNMAVPHDAETAWTSHLLAEQPVSLVGRPVKGNAAFRFPEELRTTPILLPSLQSSLRVAFDLLMEQAGFRPRILAEVDDMAMLRLLARESPGVTLVPPVVVRDELSRGVLVERYRLPTIRESFYAITRRRRFPHPLLAGLLSRARL
ncbi:MAG TPA: LysR family transcriptional regulator [Myxococcaceae bacterium]|nr:LysR family transcriptional regulator [Myxococcaceae bacterium]